MVIFLVYKYLLAHTYFLHHQTHARINTPTLKIRTQKHPRKQT